MTERRASVSSDSAGFGDFFRYHGWLSPGVRLFRGVNFAAKALIISLSFMLPMLGLLGWLLQSQAEQALSARMEATRTSASAQRYQAQLPVAAGA